MKQRAVGIGIVGAGRVFEQHARACTELGARARLLAIADVDEGQVRKATSRYFIPFAYRDYRSLLDRKDIAAVAVCTPPAAHERIVVDALDAGKFVICEKPLAHTLQAADRIIAAARRAPGKLSTVFQFRYLPDMRRTRWLLDNGHLGRLLFGRFSRYSRFDVPAKPLKPGKAPKAGKERADWWGRWGIAGGGVVMTQLIHDFDLMCHLFGRPVEVTAAIDTLKEQIESEDTCAAAVRFESGAMACCFGTMTAHRSSSAFDVVGELASAHAPWTFECAERKRREQLIRQTAALFPSPSESSAGAGLLGTLSAQLSRFRARPATAVTGHTPYLAAVLDAIADDRPLPVGPQEARTALELCTAVYLSALTRQPTAVPIASSDPCYAGLTTLDYDDRRSRGIGQETMAVVPVALHGSGR